MHNTSEMILKKSSILCGKCSALDEIDLNLFATRDVGHWQKSSYDDHSEQAARSIRHRWEKPQVYRKSLYRLSITMVITGVCVQDARRESYRCAESIFFISRSLWGQHVFLFMILWMQCSYHCRF